MGTFALVSFAIAIGIDSLVISAGILRKNVGIIRILEFCLVFSLANVGMFIIGLYFGGALAVFSSWASIAGAGIIIYFGLKMLGDFFKSTEGIKIYFGKKDVLFAIFSLSLDNLPIGFGAGISGMPTDKISVSVIMIVIFMCIFGFLLGKRIQRYMGKMAKLVGGIILIGMGINFYFLQGL